MNETPLVGEPLALDLVNTRVGTPDGERDMLETADALRLWLALEDGRLTAPEGEIDLTTVHALRSHVARAVEAARAGAALSVRDLQALTRAQCAAPAYRELSWDGATVMATLRRSGTATAILVAQLADAAVDLLTDPAVRKIRPCEGSGCRMLFLPAHPRRRWCSPAICGNRVRVARYYQRHKVDEHAAR